MLLQMELTPNRSNVGRKKTSQEKDKTLYLEVLSGTSESFPMELSLITEKRRLTNVALLHLQRNDIEGKDNFFVFSFPSWEAQYLKITV